VFILNAIGFFNETGYNIDEEIETIKKLINYAIKELKLKKLEFNIIFVDNEKIRELNKTYRKIDNYTDVISFALEDYQDIKYIDRRLLGDIYISVDKAKEQSIEYQHSLLRELSFLSIHGLLHLLGYNHENKSDEDIMFSKQEAILNGYGIKR
jgi:probable rRNA maturation factor